MDTFSSFSLIEWIHAIYWTILLLNNSLSCTSRFNDEPDSGKIKERNRFSFYITLTFKVLFKTRARACLLEKYINESIHVNAVDNLKGIGNGVLKRKSFLMSSTTAIYICLYIVMKLTQCWHYQLKSHPYWIANLIVLLINFVHHY